MVVGQAGVCFMLSCGCGASKSVFHVKLWLHAKQECDSRNCGCRVIVVVGLAGVCFMLSCGCWASRSVFHV